MAAAVGLFLVAGGAAVALTLGQDDSGGGDTGDTVEPSDARVDPDEVVVPLDVGEGIALYALEQDGTEDLLVAPEGDNALSVPSLSPDRRFVYFRQGPPDDFQVFGTEVLDLATGERSPMVADGEDAQCVGRPAWRPGSTTVALLCREGEVNVPYQGQQGEDGRISGLEPLGTLGPGWANVAYRDNGDLVLTQGPNGDEPGIHTGPTADSLERLTSGVTGDTAASPFDAQIAYEQDGVLWLVRADGATPECPSGASSQDPGTGVPRCQLTDGGSGVDIKPAWEEVGDGAPARLVFVRSEDVDVVAGELLVLDLAGSGEPEPWSESIGTVSGQPAWAHR